jgi:hypothetical protein
MISEYPAGGSEPTNPQETTAAAAAAESQGAAPEQTQPPHVEAQAAATGAETRETGKFGEVWLLVRQLLNQASHLIRQETQLAKAEFREAVHAYARNSVLLAIGAAVALCGLLALLAAAVAGVYVLLNLAVPWYIAAWLSPLIVGAAAGLMAYGLIGRAIHTLRHTTLKPTKTIDTVRQDAQWLKDRLK